MGDFFGGKVYRNRLSRELGVAMPYHMGGKSSIE